MKTWFQSLGLSLSVMCGLNTALAQGTAFTYQGQLTDGGLPANGVYDLRFTIYDSTNLPSNVIAGPLTNSTTGVSNGLFTVTLDFGPGVFTGLARFLEISVRTNGGAAFATLSPRQELTPAPYAIFAAGASNVLGVLPAGGLVGTYAGTVTFNNGSNQFVGSFTGNGAGLTNVNAVTLGGLGPNNFWQTTGNAGTTPGLNFVGTTDSNAFEIHVDGYRVLRVEPDPRLGFNAGNVVGGDPSNAILQPQSGGDVIAGGGFAGGGNIIASNSSGVFIGAGSLNLVGPNVNDSVIAGGFGNSVQAYDAVIAGGRYNAISNFCDFSVIGGGYSNLVDSGAQGATIGGGGGGVPFVINHISSTLATVSGGSGNVIQAFANDSTIAGGRQNEIDTGAWGAVIGGGHGNWIQATSFPGGTETNSSYATISGGYGNLIQTNGDHSTIGGGLANIIGGSSDGATVAGGVGNTIQPSNNGSTIGGGSGNLIQAGAGGSGVIVANTIAGGTANNIGLSCDYSTIGGGFANTIQAQDHHAFIGGGSFNTIGVLCYDALIAGGSLNIIQPAANDAVIAGGLQNEIDSNAVGAFIGGGESNWVQTAIATGSSFATIAGGFGNQIQTNANYSVIGGGEFNSIQPNSTNCTVGGGFSNHILANGYANVIAGGDFNTIQTNAETSFIGGGLNNTILGSEAVIPGGFDNRAIGDYSFAAGYRAVAAAPGCFVWADSSSSAFFTSTRTNQFLVRAVGGVGLGTTNTPDAGLSLGFNTHLNDSPIYLRAGTDHNHGLAYCGPGVTNFSSTNLPDGPVLWGYSGGALGAVAPALSGDLAHGHAMVEWSSTSVTVFGTFNNMSDRDSKEDFQPVSPAKILNEVVRLPVSQWHYKIDPTTPHIGPTAQDFHALFGVGTDEKHIAPIDEGGVALAAIQGLNQKLEQRDAQIQGLNQKLQEKDAQIQAVAQRLAALENLLGTLVANEVRPPSSVPEQNE